MKVLSTAFLWLLVSAPAWGQIPEPASPEDIPEDIKEVEDVVPDTEYLPADDRQSPIPDEGAKEKIARIHARELALSENEIRRKFAYRAWLGLGSTVPWQIYSLGFLARAGENWGFGLTFGGGSYRERGIAVRRSYDLTYRSRSFALVGRYFLPRLQALSIGVAVGYAAWEGNLKPQGADTSADDDVGRITSAFQASGAFGGISLALTGLWKNGFFIEWVPVGISRTQIYTSEWTRDSRLAGEVVDSQLKATAFYGLTNVTFGTWF